MPDFDVVVIGGGPAGYAAALKAAERGASVALIEREAVGGACVNYSCIPTNILMDEVARFVEAQELAAFGIFSAGEQFNFARAVARKDSLVEMIGTGIAAQLKRRKVVQMEGRAAFADARTVSVTGSDGVRSVSAGAFVLATGTRWEPPTFPGLATERVLTADSVQHLVTPPASAVVLGTAVASTAFGLEYASLLAAAGTQVTLVVPEGVLTPGFDADVSQVAEGLLGELGIDVRVGWSVSGSLSQDAVTIRHGEDTREVAAEVVIAPDVRSPLVDGLNLAAAGVTVADSLPVGKDCRTSVPHIFAAGDMTGGPMLTSVATHMGEVAGTNAAGGEAVTRLSALPHGLHTLPEMAWVGQTERTARESFPDIGVGLANMAYNPRATLLGVRQGVVKVVVDSALGEILGVQAVGPGAHEIVAVSASLMQAEASAHDLAAMVPWHPSMTESLVDAARLALASG